MLVFVNLPAQKMASLLTKTKNTQKGSNTKRLSLQGINYL
jgi:hypothetical protein